MYQQLDEQVDVIAVFQNRSVKPARFCWRGRVYKVAHLTGTWKSREGASIVRHFALVDTDANVFELTYNERLSHWVVSKVWVE